MPKTGDSYDGRSDLRRKCGVGVDAQEVDLSISSKEMVNGWQKA